MLFVYLSFRFSDWERSISWGEIISVSGFGVKGIVVSWGCFLGLGEGPGERGVSVREE